MGTTYNLQHPPIRIAQIVRSIEQYFFGEKTLVFNFFKG